MKADVAARFIMDRVKGVTVTPHNARIQEFDQAFYSQFNIVICGLDNLGARRWINATLCSLVEVDDDDNPDPSTIVPYIDGGTEGFMGQVRVIVPRVTACLECSINTFAPQVTFQLCTLAHTPRKPEHCIAYAMLSEWPKAFPGRKYDTDSAEDMRWIYERAKTRAAEFGIEGVTYMNTMGVVKNIIPAIASTNALISAACVNEAFKLMSYASQGLNNYFQYSGGEGTYSYTFEYQRSDNCCACNIPRRVWDLPATTTVQDVIDQLKEAIDLQLSDPTLSTPADNVWLPKPEALRAATLPNLEKPISSFIASGESFAVTDPVFPKDISLDLRINFTDTSPKDVDMEGGATEGSAAGAGPGAGAGASE